jgi:hypothetical protein
LSLYDGNGQYLDRVVSSHGTARLDRNVDAGQAYLVRLAGNVTSATLNLVNSVQVSGNDVAVSGTGESDDLRLVDNGIVVNGVHVPLDTLENKSITISGGGGDDTFVVTPSAIAVFKNSSITYDGGPGANTAIVWDASGDSGNAVILQPFSATWSGLGGSINIANSANISAYSQGEESSATLIDSLGGAECQAHSSYTVLSGPGFTNRVTGFHAVIARAATGGNGTVTAYNDTGTAVITQAPGLVTLSDDHGVTIRLESFGTVYVGPPSVTINQAASQNDPARDGFVHFTVVFSEPVTGLDSSAVVLSGTADGAKVESVSGSGTMYDVAVSATGRGMIVATLGPGAAHDALGNASFASASADNAVDYLAWNVTMPWIDVLADQSVLEDAKTLTKVPLVGITPGQKVKPLLRVTATSSNPNLIPAPRMSYKSPAATGSLSFKPVADQVGTSVITVTVRDPGADGKWKTADDGIFWQDFAVNVTPVNHRPNFKKGRNLTVLEDSSKATIAKWLDPKSIYLGPANESGQKVTFAITVDKPELFAEVPTIDSATGTLVFTPAKDAAGVALVSVELKDDGGTANGGIDTSAVQTFRITITGVNDPPSFTKGADVTVLEDSGATKVVRWATAIMPGPANEVSQKVSFIVTSDNPKLFSKQPAIAPDGTLSFTPANDAFGTATVSVKVKDGGGAANGGIDTSAVQTFKVSVSAPRTMKLALKTTTATKSLRAADDAALMAVLSDWAPYSARGLAR